MTKKPKFELNRASDLADVDAELDAALAKLDATSAKVTEILAGAPPRTSASVEPVAELSDGGGQELGGATDDSDDE